MNTTISDEQFSIIRGGLLEKALTLLRIVKPNHPQNMIRTVIFFIVIAWLPLLIMTLISGQFLSGEVQVPFLYDFPFHIRFLMAVPMLFMAEKIVDERVKLVVHQFNKAGLLHEEGLKEFELAKMKADRMVESSWAEAIILVLIVGNQIFRWVINDDLISSWQFPGLPNNDAMSNAGFWSLTVSIPIFQFIVLRWLWRWIIWFRLHFMISKASLNLSPTHPDRAGGIGFLGEPPAPFSMITMTFSVVISSVIASRMIFFNAELSSFYVLIGVFVLICVLINIVPLLIYFKPLRYTRIKGIFEYSALVQKHHLQFKAKWFKSTTNEELLIGNPDISSMCDFTPVYDAIVKMNPFPFNIKTMLAAVVASVAPLVPLAALTMPLADLLKVLVGLIL